jgi:spermidine/putrescine transport system permease protein
MGHIVLAIPYTILILVPRLERLDVRLEEAARDLGAGAFETFRLITFPLLLPAIVSALLVAFVLSFDEIVVASFVAGDTTTFPLYLFSQLRFPTLLPQVIAVAVIVMAASALVLVGAEIGRRVVERRLGAELAEPAGIGGA